MDNREFQSLIRRMAEVEPGSEPPSADAVWWRARLRRALITENHAVRPMRIAEGVACAVCLIAVGGIAVNARVAVLALFLAITLVIAGGVRATLFAKS